MKTEKLDSKPVALIVGAGDYIGAAVSSDNRLYPLWPDGRGGDLTRVDLPDYPVDKGSSTPVRLLDFTQENRWVFQTGARSASGDNEPNWRWNTTPNS